MLRGGVDAWRRSVCACVTAGLALFLSGPAEAPGAADRCPSCWRPKPGSSWQIQLQGRLDLSVPARIYELDGFDTPARVVASLQARGRRVICYLNAGAWEAWRPDRARFRRAVLGEPLEQWPGERWLDIRRLDVLGPIMVARLELCRNKGFDAVDPDNVDGYMHATGFALTAGDQVRYNRWLAASAHRLGLSVGLKNDLAQVGELHRHFDFAVNERCFEYGECGLLRPFVATGKAVFVVEYRGERSRICPKARRLRISVTTKRRTLDAYRLACTPPSARRGLRAAR